MSQLSQPPPPTHLILICCHAIYLSGPTHGSSPSEWLLSPFQLLEVPTFTTHIKTGLSLLSTSLTSTSPTTPPSTPSSLLILSGSSTHPSTSLSEAQSYLNLCIDNSFFGIKGFSQGEEGRNRILLEEQALDSFANLMYSLILFWKHTKCWPEKITIISHGFKKERFMELHVPAIRYPLSRTHYIGIDPEYMQENHPDYDAVKAEGVRKGERERGYGLWEVDLFGEGSVLREKREGRNFWDVGQEFFGSQKEREDSGVRSRIVEWEQKDGMIVREEVLSGEWGQPWEGAGLEERGARIGSLDISLGLGFGV